MIAFFMRFIATSVAPHRHCESGDKEGRRSCRGEERRGRIEVVRVEVVRVEVWVLVRHLRDRGLPKRRRRRRQHSILKRLRVRTVGCATS